MYQIDDLNELKKIIKKCGNSILKFNAEILNNKSKHDLLTKNDIIIEKMIITEILEKYKGVNIISEESYYDNELTGDTFVIDPIDGTCNFANDIKLFGIQVAYFHNNLCLAAFIYLPFQNNMFIAYKEKGCFLNEKRIFVNPNKKSKDGILIISDYYDDINIKIEKQFELVKRLQCFFLKTRQFGAACYDFSLIAQGSALAYITYYHKLWDIAPGLLIASEAGCVYSNLDGKPFNYNNKGIVVANSSENLSLILNEYKNI